MLSTFSSPPPNHFLLNHVIHGQPMQSMRGPMGTSSPVGWPGGFVTNAGVNGHNAGQGLVSQGSISNIHSVFQHQQPQGPSGFGQHGSMGSMSSLVPSSIPIPVPFQQFPPTMPALPTKNTVEMTRDMLLRVLEHFSVLLEEWFDFPSASPGSNYPQSIRLVVHGGACMLLHSQLYALSEQQASVFATRGDPDNKNMGHRRTTTRDVDFIARGFLAEYGRVWTRGSVSGSRGGGKGRGMDAKDRLRGCIHETAVMFGLGEDWMNADADVALPMAYDPTHTPYDPIYTAAIQPNNIDLHTIYTSPNMRLTLISVTPFWAVSLKLVRYTKWDRVDVCLLLRNGTLLSGTQWTPEMLQSWLEANCWAMGYANYDERKKAEMKGRIEHAIWGLGEWTKFVGGSTGDMFRNSTGGGVSGSWESALTREGPATRKNERQWSAHEAMGGGVPGSVVGGEQASQMGWSFGTEGVIHGTSARPAGHGQLSVVDWGTSTAPKPKKTRNRRRRSISQPPDEIFIPPGVEDLDFDDGVQHTTDPYSLATLDRAVHAIDLSQRQHQRQSARHSQQQPGQSSNSQSHPNLTRKQKEKERKRERIRSRAHKLGFGHTGYASSDDDGIGGLNDSDFETNTEEADKENRWANSNFDETRNHNDKEIRDRHRDTHPTYPFPGESSQQQQQQQQQHQYQQHQWDSNTSANNTLLPPSTSTLRGHSPNPNVNGTNNGRLSALDLFPAGSNRRGSGVSLRDPGPIPPPAGANGFIPPGAEGPSHHQQSHYASDHSARNDPSYLAQLQFEAQVREYHGEKEKEERRARREREMGFYESAANTTRKGGREGSHPGGGGQDGRGRDPNVNTNATSWHGLEVHPRPNTRPEPGQRMVWHEGHLGRDDLNPYERRREEKGNEITSYRNRNGWMDG